VTARRRIVTAAARRAPAATKTRGTASTIRARSYNRLPHVQWRAITSAAIRASLRTRAR
jgi:hypothetical protein